MPGRISWPRCRVFLKSLRTIRSADLPKWHSSRLPRSSLRRRFSAPYLLILPQADRHNTPLRPYARCSPPQPGGNLAPQRSVPEDRIGWHCRAAISGRPDADSILPRCEEWYATRHGYDAAISFAEEDRSVAETISARLRSVGLEYIRQRGREGSRSAQRPVRVKLTRADAFAAATCPPDGETENWWRRLNEALGTMSSDFVNASLLQLQAAARSPFGTISQIGCARHSDGLHPYGRHVDPFQTGQRTRNGATNCRLRISRGSFNENVCDAGRGSPTLASWGPPICPRRTRPCE